MKLLKKLPIVRIAACVLMISIVTSVALFSGTHAWFVDEETIKIDGQMGAVSVTLDENNMITNDSSIDILLRVRVIVEWKKDGQYILGTPAPASITQSIVGSNWKPAKGIDGGDFLIYQAEGSEKFGDTGYYTIKPNPMPFSINYTPPSASGYTAEVSFIVEALQATQTAYDYTVENASTPGVTSWELGGDN
jgi:hypothetical protein